MQFPSENPFHLLRQWRDYTASELADCALKECITWIVITSDIFRIRLVLVPGQSGIIWNCKADKLAKALLLQFQPIGSKLVLRCSLMLNLSTSRKLGKRWSTTTYTTSRFFWVRVNRKRFSELLAYSKVNIATVLSVLLGHYPINSHAVQLSILSDAF